MHDTSAINSILMTFSISVSLTMGVVHLLLWFHIRSKYTHRKREHDNSEGYIESEALRKQIAGYLLYFAHEATTPLTLINNFIRFHIDKYGISEELSIAKSNTELLEQNMHDFLDYDKFSRNSLLYNHSCCFNLSKALKVQLIMFKEVCSKKHISLNSSIDHDIIIRMDPAAFDRIIHVLLTSTFKYTPDRDLIDVVLMQDIENIVLTISSNKKWHKVYTIDEVFRPYSQLLHDNSFILNSNIGLAMVQKIVDSLNGGIELSNKSGERSMLTLMFPKHEVDNLPFIEYQPSSQGLSSIYLSRLCSFPEYDDTKPVLFVVEENHEILLFLQQHLMQDYNFYYADNGRKALDLIKTIPCPDMIISDIVMDSMNGYVFKDALNNTENYSAIPFLFFTAGSSEVDTLKELGLGVIDFIQKPFNINELRLKIASILKQQSELDLSLFERRELKLNQMLNNTNLTVREREAVDLALLGKDNQSIATELNVSIGTIKQHLNKAYKKLNIVNRYELLNLYRTFDK